MNKHRSKLILNIIFYVVAFVSFCFATQLLMNFLDEWRKGKVLEMAIESKKVTTNKQKLLKLEQVALFEPTEGNLINAGVQARMMKLYAISEKYLLGASSADGLYELGCLYYEIGNFSEAEDAYIKAIYVNNNKKYFFALGENYLKKGEIEKAYENFLIFRNMDQLDTENNFLFLLSGIATEKENNGINSYSLSKEHKEKLQTIVDDYDKNTNSIEVYELFKAQGYPQSAFVYLEHGKNEGLLDRDGFLVLGNEYFGRGIYWESYYSFLEARNKDPYYPQTYQQLIKAAKTLNLTDEAREYTDQLSLIIW